MLTMIKLCIFTVLITPVLMFQLLVGPPRFKPIRLQTQSERNRRRLQNSQAMKRLSKSSTQLFSHHGGHHHQNNIPKLIVFDLDGLIWTPALYHFRKKLQQEQKKQKQKQNWKQQWKRTKFGKDVSTTVNGNGGNNATIATTATATATVGQTNNLTTTAPVSPSSSTTSSSSSFIPRAHKDVKLKKGFQDLITYGILQQVKEQYNVKFAIASRTKSMHWAYSLLDQFEIRELFDYIEIYPGSKEKHFQNLQLKSGGTISYNDMLFFDDTRDGPFGCCVPISQMGVLSVHCPNGLDTIGMFTMGINKYKEEWIDRSVNCIVESDGTLTQLHANMTTNFTTTSFNGASSSRNRSGRIMKLDENRTYTGVIKKIEPEKQYGFIQYRNGRMREVFFHYNGFSMSDSETAINDEHLHQQQRHPLILQEGDHVSFQLQYDPTRNQTMYMASNISIMQPATEEHEATDSKEEQNTPLVPMRCVSMNQPFASLVANGYKTLESRNGTMFTMYPEGTQLLVHVTKHSMKSSSNYHIDPNNTHIDIMKSDNNDMTDEQIEQLKQLPIGFGKGDIVAIMEIGKTYEMSYEERSKPSIQRQIVLSASDSGKYVTEIKHVSYLKEPIKNVPGQPGIFKVHIDPNVLPESPHSEGDKDENASNDPKLQHPKWNIPSSRTKEELLEDLCDSLAF